MAKVIVIMGSMSDAEKMRPCIDTLKEFDVEYEVRCLSAHRTLDKLQYYVKDFYQGERLVYEADQAITEKTIPINQVSTYKNACGVIIAAAGMAAALPGVIASMTTIPVIGVPLSGSALNGQDALYSIVQMPPGIPVATVGIDAAKNAALLAIQILAPTSVEDLHKKLSDYREKQAEKVLASNTKIADFYEDEGRRTKLC